MGKITTVLITGITGYLGSNLAKFLAKRTYKIIGIVRENSDLKELTDIYDHITLYNNSSRKDLELAFTNHPIDIIIHTATSYGRADELIDQILESNVVFPSMLLEIAVKHSVPVFINTDTALPSELNLYSLTKHLFKEILQVHSNAIKVINLKLEYFFGPQDKKNKFITYLISKMISKDSVLELSECSQIRDFIFIEDVLEAYLTVILNVVHLENLSTIPIGIGSGVQLKDLVLKIQAIANNYKIKLDFGKVPMRDGEVMESIADITILKRLGWKPRFTLEDGLINTFNIDKNGIYK